MVTTSSGDAVAFDLSGSDPSLSTFYRLKRGEGIEQLLAKAKIDKNEVERLNPKVDLSQLAEGQFIQVRSFVLPPRRGNSSTQR